MVWKGKGRGSEVRHHLQDLAIVDAGRIPLDPIGRLTNVASDLTLSHAAHKLLPRGLPVATELHTRLGGVVEELIVLNPEGGVPGFVGCVAVHWSSVVDVAIVGPQAVWKRAE